MIDLAARIKTPALAGHCRDLAADKTTLKGIAQRAQAYLKTLDDKGSSKNDGRSGHE